MWVDPLPVHWIDPTLPLCIASGCLEGSAFQMMEGMRSMRCFDSPSTSLSSHTLRSLPRARGIAAIPCLAHSGLSTISLTPGRHSGAHFTCYGVIFPRALYDREVEMS